MICIITRNKLLVCLLGLVEFGVVHKNKHTAILNKRIRLVKLIDCSRYLFSATRNERILCFLDCKDEHLERFTCVIVVAVRNVLSVFYCSIKLGYVYKCADRRFKICRSSINIILVSGALLRICGFVCRIQHSPGIRRIILRVERCCLIKRIDKSLIVHLHELSLCVYKSLCRVIERILISRAYRILRYVKSIDKCVPLKHGIIVSIFGGNEFLSLLDCGIQRRTVQLAILCRLDSVIKSICRIVNVKLISGIYKSVRIAQCIQQDIPLEYGIIRFVFISNELFSFRDRIVKIGVVHLSKIFNDLFECLYCIINDTLNLIFTRYFKRCLCLRYCSSELCEGVIGIFISSIEKILCVLNSILERLVIHKNEHAAIFNQRICLIELLCRGINHILISRRKAQFCFVDRRIQRRERSACVIVDSVYDQAYIFNRTVKIEIIHLDKRIDSRLEIFCCGVYRFLIS